MALSGIEQDRAGNFFTLVINIVPGLSSTLRACIGPICVIESCSGPWWKTPAVNPLLFFCCSNRSGTPAPLESRRSFLEFTKAKVKICLAWYQEDRFFREKNFVSFVTEGEEHFLSIEQDPPYPTQDFLFPGEDLPKLSTC